MRKMLDPLVHVSCWVNHLALLDQTVKCHENTGMQFEMHGQLCFSDAKLLSCYIE